MKDLSQRDQDRLATLRLFCVECIVASAAYSVIYGMAGSWPLAFLLLSAIPLTGVTLFIIHRFKTPSVAGNWVMGFGYGLFFIFAYWSGGIQSPILAWSISIPVVATLICGRRSGLVWLVFVLIKLSFFYFADVTGMVALPETPYHAFNLKTVFYSSMFGVVVFAFLPILLTEEFKEGYSNDLEKKNRDLTKALENIRVLSGMLPMCAWCRKIRNDKGYWDRIETYLEDNAGVTVSHSLCPECFEKESERLKKN